MHTKAWRRKIRLPIPDMLHVPIDSIQHRAGIWATLQFKWVQLQYPVAAVVGERLLMSSSLPLAGAPHGYTAQPLLHHSSMLGMALHSVLHANPACIPRSEMLQVARAQVLAMSS